MSRQVQRAWAVKHDGKLELKSLYPYPRGAMVNFLSSFMGVPVSGKATDEVIRQAFMVIQKHHDVKLVEVGVVEVAEEDTATVRLEPEEYGHEDTNKSTAAS